MQLTKPQLSRFWRDWSSACKTQGWTKSAGWTETQITQERYNLLRESGFDSLTEVDRGAGFDRVLAALGQLRENVAKTIETLPAETVTVSAGPTQSVRVQDTPGLRRRLVWKCRQYARPLGGDTYILALARDRFHLTTGLSTIEDLTTDHLHQLMITLAARISSRRQSSQTSPKEVAAVQCGNPF